MRPPSKVSVQLDTIGGLRPKGDMQRREFLSVFGAATVAMPLAARAQETERIRHIAVLMLPGPDDPEGQSRVGALRDGLQQAGWIIGRNLQADVRWNMDSPDEIRRYTAEELKLTPEVIVANGTPVAAALQHTNRNIPIVFVGVVDPVGADLVGSLAHPGGNATGFALFEYGLSGKWLELLKEITPGIARVAVMRDPAIASGAGQLGAIQAAAASSGVELKPINVSDVREIERAIASIATGPIAGLIVAASPLAIAHRDLIISLAARYKLPAVYTGRLFVTSGGLISYGPDPVDQYRQAAGYVDRILKGERPEDLPVQAPTKYELVINLKTAKTLGLTIPEALLSTADEVIE
jgi:putative tryptophan/tyrosine transport system substrate-binding protein